MTFCVVLHRVEFVLYMFGYLSYLFLFSVVLYFCYFFSSCNVIDIFPCAVA